MNFNRPGQMGPTPECHQHILCPSADLLRGLPAEPCQVTLKKLGLTLIRGVEAARALDPTLKIKPQRGITAGDTRKHQQILPPIPDVDQANYSRHFF